MAIFVPLVFLIGCGGGASSQGGAGFNALPNFTSPMPIVSGVVPTPAPTSTAPVNVHLTYALPGTSQSTSSLARHAQSTAQRQLQYVSTSNTVLTITVTPLGGSPVTFGPTSCTTASCGINFTANPGPNTIAFSLSDGTNVLSTFRTTTIIQPLVVNTLAFTANPVVNSVTLSLASAMVNGGTAADDLLTVNALDADGNTIVGNSQYLDTNGNPLLLTLATSNAQAGGTGTGTLRGSTRISGPGQAATYFHYDGSWLASSTISVSSTSPALSSLTGTTLTIRPYATAYAIPYSGASMAVGRDGNFWLANGTTFTVVSTAGKTLATYSCAACTGLTDITSGPNGNLWFTDYSTGIIGEISLNGAVTTFAQGASYTAHGLTSTPDGAVWWLSLQNGYYSRTDMSGNTVHFNDANNNFTICLGGDGNLWMQGNSKEYQFSLTGKILQSITGTQGPCVAGPDGNTWIGSGATINSVTTNGTVTPYTLQTGASVGAVTVGQDGNIWFTEGGTTNSIGMITTSGTLTEYGTANGITSATGAINLGSDGNIWFLMSGNKLMKFVY